MKAVVYKGPCQVAVLVSVGGVDHALLDLRYLWHPVRGE